MVGVTMIIMLNLNVVIVLALKDRSQCGLIGWIETIHLEKETMKL